MKDGQLLAPADFIIVICGRVGEARSGVIEFDDRDQWIAAVGSFRTIGFGGFGPGTVITDQYAHLGVLFTDGNDRIEPFDPITFPNDGWGT